MNFFIGLTDYDWYCELRDHDFDEVNFWRPGSTRFLALQPNDLFLFQLKKPYYSIVGGGFFVRYSFVPIDLAWQAFGMKNGTQTREAFANRIMKYREKNHIETSLPSVGCIILTQPFFFDEPDWIRNPSDWPYSAVVGKNYDTGVSSEAQRIYRQVQERLSAQQNQSSINQITGERYTEGFTKLRLGQGAFRIVVTDLYQRRCAVSGEKALPVLEAAHIKPYAMNGENVAANGVLLRSDIHTLFDAGYVTITDRQVVEVSKRLYLDFGNGKDYYRFHGKALMAEPANKLLLLSRENLNWHNEHIYLG
jgi:putative restriction endonuclease